MDDDTPYVPRQLAVLDAEIPLAPSPVCVIVYDTQGVGPLIEHLCGRSGEFGHLADGVAWFELSSTLPTGERLVERIVEAAKNAAWIFVHADTSTLPEPVLHVMKFIADQKADLPRVVVVGEETDVRYGNDAMRQLFEHVGSQISLV
jgi:hypothetical protein